MEGEEEEEGTGTGTEDGVVVGVDLSKMDDAAKQIFLQELARKLTANVCVLCAKEFETKAELEVHFWDHTEDRYELECLICGATFFMKEQLTSHIESHMQSNPPATPPSPTSPVFRLSK
jgi:DNA-directed RNA polymerase subunit RPC12/RpoP